MTDPDLEWLLCVMPSLMGERSGHGALVAALESGTPGSGSASSAGAEDAAGRAMPHVARARRLMAVWATLGAQHRLILQAHYLRPASRAHGVGVHLGELAAVCLLLTKRRHELELACSNASRPLHAERIQGELRRARRAVEAAHQAWRTARAASVLTWLGG